MYELYELNNCNEINNFQLNEQKILIEKPSKNIFGNDYKGVLISLFWRIITFDKAKVYVIRDNDGSIVHYSCVFPKCYKFPFLKKNDVEVGPCFTSKNHRGKGFYPYVLAYIAKKEILKKGNLYLMINTKNKSSIRGVKKVGFKPIALMRKNTIGQHVIVRRYNSIKEAQNEFYDF